MCILAAELLHLDVLAREGEEAGSEAGIVAAAAAAEADGEVERGLLLDVVIDQCPAIIQLPPGVDQPLVVRWDACPYNSLVEKAFVVPIRPIRNPL